MNKFSHRVRIAPKKSWLDFDLKGVWNRRNLLFLLILRDIRLRYRQTFLGVLWTAIQTVAPMLVFVFVFGLFFKNSGSNLPYAIYVFAGLVIWQFFSAAVNSSGNSFNANAHTIGKVYFPRLILPLAAVLSSSVDFLIGCAVLLILMRLYAVQTGWQIVLIPFVWLLAALLAFAVGTTIASLSVVYRDARNFLPLSLQLLMFLTPIIYSLDSISEKWRWTLKLNPLTGIVAGFRWAFYGGEFAWFELAISVSATVFLFVSALVVFTRIERILADYL